MQHQAARRLGKTAVVTNQHAETQAAEVMHGIGLFARSRKAIDAEKGEMRFAIDLQLPFRPEKHGDIEQVLPLALEHAHDRPDFQSPAVRG